MTDQTLRVYKSRSGQWSGQLIEDGEEVGRIAGCESTEEVIDAAFDQGWQGFEVIDQTDGPSTTEKLASYDTAKHIFNMIIAGHAALIAAEKAKVTPDEKLITQLRNETLALRQQSNALAFEDTAAVEYVIRTLGPLARADR